MPIIQTLINLILCVVAAVFVATTSHAADFTQKIHTTPDVFAPSIGGTQPCLIPISAGLGVTGFGVTGGSALVDQGCEDRNWIALLYNIGQHELSLVYACMLNPRIGEAMARLGRNCMDPTGIKDNTPTAKVDVDPQQQFLSSNDNVKAELLARVFKYWDMGKGKE